MMTRIFVASFNRASDGALKHLIKTLKKRGIYTNYHPEADYILACGDRTETFDFVLERFRENKKIIHLWAGEISQGTHDEVYRHAMTLMSMIQLCTNDRAVYRVVALCRAVDKKPNIHVVGNVMLDDMTVDESKVPDYFYDLVLYNPPTVLTESEIMKEIIEITEIVEDPYYWIEPNGDMHSDLLKDYVNTKNLPRSQFLGMIKNCRKFITNSSCQYYEAPFLISKEKIIPIGKRNASRESKFADMTMTGATEKIIKILEELI